MPDIIENVELAPLTTFKIGGYAKYFVQVTTDEEIKSAVLWARAKTLPFVILAGGSNMLFPDGELDALVIQIISDKSSFQGTKLIADAGCSLLHLIKKGSMIGLGGWESLAGIPGTIGGAVRGNAGAFGTEIKDVFESALALNTVTYKKKVFTNAECEFAYRNSFFKQNPEWVVLEAIMQLKEVEAGDSIRDIDNTIIERERRHLQNVQAAGSYFTNPVAPEAIQKMFEEEKNAKSREGRVPAGWLIEKCGLKGAQVGGAIASEQHPNYLVNSSNATAKDVLALATKIKEEVWRRFNIRLVEEAVVVRG